MSRKNEVTFALFEDCDRRQVLQKVYQVAKSLPNNRDWEVVLRPKVRKRTLDQNSILHAIFNDISAEIGESPAKVKEDFKTSLGLKIPHIGLDGKMREINKPTEEYEVDEMSAFLTRVLALCDELGFDVATHRAAHDKLGEQRDD